MSSCSGGYATSGVTYNRATFRAAWNNTDFALMELRNSPTGDPRFSWLGWDRSGNTPTSGTGIHHPAGDVMKISFDYNSLSSNTSTISWTGGTSSPVNTHWVVELDSGTMEGGSSGAPLFNQNKRVVGQLHGGASGCAPVTKYFGQFHRSWTGGGTNSTRLSNWLDPNGSGVMTTNTSKSPTISGPTSVCNQATYTITNLPQGATVQWSVSNNNLILLFQQGGSATFKKNGNGVNLINARIVLGTNRIDLTPKQVWVSNPVINEIIGQQHFPNGGTGHFQANVLSNENISYNWSVSPSLPISFNGTHAIIQFPWGNGDFRITFTATNSCGSAVSYYFVSTGEYEPFSLSPNPATDVVTVQLNEAPAPQTSQGLGKAGRIALSGVCEIQLWSGMTMLRSFRTNEPTFQIPMAGLPAGLYFVRVVKDGQTYTQKLIKK